MEIDSNSGGTIGAMTGHEVEDTGWWLVEPPDQYFDPPEDEPPEDTDFVLERQLLREARGLECLDGTQAHPMFENVQVIEENDGLRFRVPRRLIETPTAGKWIFEIYGRRKWFKERDDFGDVRFTVSGDCLWIPHLFPFEETNADGLPLILDRERCEVMVTLQQAEDNADIATTAAIKTQFGELSAQESALSYNPEFIRYFDEFEFQGKPLVADTVTYPPHRWESLEHYFREMHPDMDSETYYSILLGQLPFPEEYGAQFEPNDWQERERSGFSGTAFGSIWVPVDELRRGIEADISFPCFADIH